MLTDHGPIVTASVSLGIGLFSGLAPCVDAVAPRTIAVFGRTRAPWANVALSATFVAGVATILTPLGFVAALSGGLVRYVLWQNEQVRLSAIPHGTRSPMIKAVIRWSFAGRVLNGKTVAGFR